MAACRGRARGSRIALARAHEPRRLFGRFGQPLDRGDAERHLGDDLHIAGRAVARAELCRKNLHIFPSAKNAGKTSADALMFSRMAFHDVGKAYEAVAPRRRLSIKTVICDLARQMLNGTAWAISILTRPGHQEGSTMKRSTILSLSAFAFLLGISSSAFATRVIISDPPETTPIFGLGEAIPVTWDDCATDDVCAGFVNFSGNTISSLIFQFTATDVLDGQTLDCDAEGIFSFNSCGSLPTLQSGQTYTFRFWGGSIPSGITPDFVGGTESPNGPGFQVDMTSDGLSTGNAPDMTMTPVPEPGELGVFGLGLALIGLGIGVRRRWR